MNYFFLLAALIAIGISIYLWQLYRQAQRNFGASVAARHIAVDTMRDGIIVVDMEGLVIDSNPAAQKMLAQTAVQMRGKPLTPILSQVLTFETGDTNTPKRTNITFSHADGRHEYDVQFSSLYRQDGQQVGRLIVLRDITVYIQTEKALQSQKQLFENLVTVAQATAKTPDLQNVLQNALDVSTNLTRAERGSLLVLENESRVSHSILSRSWSKPKQRAQVLKNVLSMGLAGWVVQHKQMAVIHDTKEDDRWLMMPNEPYTTRSVMAIPIVSKETVLGVLVLQHPEPNHFQPQDEALMKAASAQMALPLRNAQMYESQRQMATTQSILFQVLNTISKHLDPDTVLKSAVAKTVELTDWCAASILVPDEAEAHLVVRTAAGTLYQMLGAAIPIEAGISGMAYHTGQVQIVPDLTESPERYGDFPDLRSGVYVPLQRGGRRLGVFSVQSDQFDAFTADDVLLCEALAEAIALAIDQARLFQSVSDERSRLQALIQTSRDGIIFVNLERQIQFVNEMALRFLQLEGGSKEWVNRPLNEALGRQIKKLSPELLTAASQELRLNPNGDSTASEGEFELGDKSYHWFTLPVKAQSLPIGHLIVMRDITQEKQLTKMREDLTETTIHDLRNPIGSAYTGIQFMNEVVAPTLDPADQQVLKLAQRSIEKALRLVNTILDISRLESDEMPIVRTEFSLTDLIDSVLTSQSPLAKSKDISLSASCDKQLPLVWADLGLIERVFENLLGNAIKFTPRQGTVEIIATYDEDADPERVLVSVRDSGTGIPQELQTSLFAKFKTGQHLRSGSGLGLAFCKMVLEAHNESIWLSNTDQTGATFTFTLPIPPAIFS